ncbi:hypothetical protein NMG60_11019547 [Bertholletia excelsa]
MATYYSSSKTQKEATPMFYSYLETPAISGNMVMGMNYPSSSRSYTNGFGENSQQQNGCGDISISPQRASVSTPPLEIMSSLEIMQNLQGQGLSLSLSTQIPSSMEIPNMGFSSFLSPTLSGTDQESCQMKQPGNDSSDSMKMDMFSCGPSTSGRDIPNLKYLKAAQQLLDEVVNVKNALKKQESRKDPMKGSEKADGESKNETALPSASGTSSNPQEPSSNPNELSSAERQDLQNRLTKLLSLVGEVDRRYKQYYHQMQIVVSSFDAISGCGSAKPYTALALQTVSRQFRCLRDAITGQIQLAQRSVGEQETMGNNSKGVGIARLRFVDQQLRQQRAIQQLGLMQQHAWRPQRGLPESSVSILRAWLFEHFLHPYPKDSDKTMLARQTGLTRSQVSNWFINARVRLWKPMVEEMYKEEIGEAEMDSNSSSEAAHKAAKHDLRTSEERGEDLQQSATSEATGGGCTGQFPIDATNAAFSSSNPEEPETEHERVNPSSGNGSLLPDVYEVSELGAFGNGNTVSLTLGLEAHHSLVTMRGDEIYRAAPSSHLFHDFVV